MPIIDKETGRFVLTFKDKPLATMTREELLEYIALQDAVYAEACKRISFWYDKTQELYRQIGIMDQKLNPKFQPEPLPAFPGPDEIFED